MRDCCSAWRGLLLQDRRPWMCCFHCPDYRCNHSIAISEDEWPDETRPSDLEPRLFAGM